MPLVAIVFFSSKGSGQFLVFLWMMRCSFRARTGIPKRCKIKSVFRFPTMTRPRHNKAKHLKNVHICVFWTCLLASWDKGVKAADKKTKKRAIQKKVVALWRRRQGSAARRTRDTVIEKWSTTFLFIFGRMIRGCCLFHLVHSIASDKCRARQKKPAQ
nr:hypothetical protein [Pandoravirus massiliensis]